MTTTKLLTVYFAAMAITLVAWVLNVAQLYWMAGVLLLLPTGSKLFARIERWGLTVEREAPPAAHQGETITVRLIAHNAVSLPKLHLSLKDVWPEGMKPLDSEPLPVHLPPGGRDTAEYDVRLGRRGAHRFPAVWVHGTDMLGLCDQKTRLPLATDILVYPRVIELPPRVLVRELGGGSAPLETSSRKGEGSSFFGIREYRPGDPLRHVHWRSSAKRGSLAVVEWEAEESRSAVLAVETVKGSERGLTGGTTLDAAAGLAASLAADVLRCGNAVRVLAAGVAERVSAAERGAEAMPSILEKLARVQAVAEVGLPAEIRRVAPHLEPGCVVCLLTPIADDDLATTTRYLQTVRLRPVVYALIDADPGGSPEWERIAREIEGQGVPVVRLYRQDEVIQQLLA
ncbi:MAG: DUF58 domain-containing protein [Actinomycetota bacterium]